MTRRYEQLDTVRSDVLEAWSHTKDKQVCTPLERAMDLLTALMKECAEIPATTEAA